MSGGKFDISNSKVINNIRNLKIVSVSGGMVAFGNGINVGGTTDSDSVGGSQLIGDNGKNMDSEVNRGNTQRDN